jgi:hypothetical protein
MCSLCRFSSFCLLLHCPLSAGTAGYGVGCSIAIDHFRSQVSSQTSGLCQNLIYKAAIMFLEENVIFYLSLHFLAFQKPFRIIAHGRAKFNTVHYQCLFENKFGDLLRKSLLPFSLLHGSLMCL